MESSQKWDFPIFKAFISNGEIEGLPGPKKKNKKLKLAPDPKRKMNFFLFFINYIPFGEKFQQNAHFLKLSSDMPLF